MIYKSEMECRDYNNDGTILSTLFIALAIAININVDHKKLLSNRNRNKTQNLTLIKE